MTEATPSHPLFVSVFSKELFYFSSVFDIYRVDNIDRYDDRDMVDVNLIEAYDRLMDFCLKHMDNRHVLENDISVDARVRIAREVIGNILIHRDYTNAFPAKLIIEKDVLRTENWSKSRFSGPLNPHALASDNEANLKPIDANLGANGANLDAKEEALYERLLDIVEKDPHITQSDED